MAASENVEAGHRFDECTSLRDGKYHLISYARERVPSRRIVRKTGAFFGQTL